MFTFAPGRASVGLARQAQTLQPELYRLAGEVVDICVSDAPERLDVLPAALVQLTGWYVQHGPFNADRTRLRALLRAYEAKRAATAAGVGDATAGSLDRMIEHEATVLRDWFWSCTSRDQAIGRLLLTLSAGVARDGKRHAP
ncbi:MAG: hypothetical protein ACFB3T_01600 [Geminicoccaceae bacterium]